MSAINSNELSSEKREAFVKAYIDLSLGNTFFNTKRYSTHAEQAYVQAGYSPGNGTKGAVKGNAANLRKQLEDIIQDEFKTALSSLSGGAIAVLKSLIAGGKSEQIKLKAALEVLNRTGLSPISVSEKTITNRDDRQVRELSEQELDDKIKGAAATLEDRGIHLMKNSDKTDKRRN